MSKAKIMDIKEIFPIIVSTGSQIKTIKYKHSTRQGILTLDLEILEKLNNKAISIIEGGEKSDSVLSPITDCYSFEDVKSVVQIFCEQHVPDSDIKDALE